MHGSKHTRSGASTCKPESERSGERQFGNSYLVEAAGIKLLFDAGLNAYTIELYLRGLGASCSELSAIFVTHEHIDHLRGAGMLARRHRLPIVATQGTFNAGAHQFGVLREMVVQPPGTEIDVGGVMVRSFAISHDAVEPCGFWIEAGGWNIVLCTDSDAPPTQYLSLSAQPTCWCWKPTMTSTACGEAATPTPSRGGWEARMVICQMPMPLGSCSTWLREALPTRARVRSGSPTSQPPTTLPVMGASMQLAILEARGLRQLPRGSAGRGIGPATSGAESTHPSRLRQSAWPPAE